MSKKIKIISMLILIIIVIGITTSKVMGVDDTPANSAFEDINFYKCVVDKYNSEHSSNTKQYADSLSDAELGSITGLSCSGFLKSDNEKITSAKGIEKLTQLTSLTLDYNNLSEIDLKANTKLTYLDLNNNKLSEIDVSKNTQLTSLDLNDNNLNEIDLKANAQLTTLRLESNNLSEIDLKANTQLKSLTLKYNNLSEIDLKANTQLTSLDLYRNNLSEIDLKANTQLTSLNLYHNNLSEIDVTKNTQLKFLTLDYNNLSEIDLKANTKLEDLDLNNNKLSEIDVTKNTQLTSLDLYINNLNEIDLKANAQLTTLRLESNNLSEIDLKANTQLTSLSLNNNKLSEIDVTKNTQLTHLDLNNNNLSEIDVSKNIKLTTLKIDKNKLLSLNINELNNLNFIDGHLYTSTVFSPQTREITPKIQNNKYIINLKEYDNKLDPSKVKLEQEGIEYDNKTGIISFTKYPKVINYTYITGKEKDMDVTLTMPNVQPIITSFFIGGQSNPEYATSTASSIYLTWNDEDVTHYCISKTNSSASCNWQSTSGKSVSTNYTLDSGDGTKILYAFIKDDGGLISAVKSDSIILDTTKPTITAFFIGGKENPKYAKTIESKIYLRHEEEDVDSYCIVSSNDSSNCEWKNTDEKEIEIEITLTSGDGIKTLYAFLKNKAGLISEVASDDIILDTTKPEIKEFSIGGKSNPEKIESNITSVYLMWEDDDVVKYCINTEENSNTCEWIDTNNKEIIQDYTLTSGDGEKTLYAYIQDEAGYISNVKVDKIIVNIPVDEPLPESPQTGGYAVGIILVGGVVLGLTYKYYLVKKEKLKRI